MERKFLDGEQGFIKIYEDRFEKLKNISELFEAELKSCLDGVPRVDRISGRVKDSRSFASKAVSGRYKDPFEEIEDQIAFRVLVFFESDIGVVREKIEKSFNLVENQFHEPPVDAAFGYQTHHFIAVVPPTCKTDKEEEQSPKTVEIQVRTLFMHAYAEPQHDFGYKGGRALSDSERRGLSWIAASAWGADQQFEKLLELSQLGNEDDNC